MTSLKYEASVFLHESFLSPILCFCFKAFSLTDAEVPMEYWGRLAGAAETLKIPGVQLGIVWRCLSLPFHHKFRVSLIMSFLFHLDFLKFFLSNRTVTTENCSKDQKSLHERQYLKSVILTSKTKWLTKFVLTQTKILSLFDNQWKRIWVNRITETRNAINQNKYF